MALPTEPLSFFLGNAMHRRRILVIAPNTDGVDLPKMTIEIGAIQRYHDATVLRGNVRDQDIAAAVVENEFEVIWFITHGNSDGVLLTDGILSTAALIQYVSADDTRLCVLNTCDSEEVAIQLASQSGADVICSIGQVDNKDALRLGQLLAGELAFCETYREAYELIASPDSNYRYYESRGMYRSFRSDHDDELLRLVYRLESDVRLLRWSSFVLLAIVVAQGFFVWQLWAYMLLK